MRKSRVSVSPIHHNREPIWYTITAQTHASVVM
jgi:hypothetical protein